PGDQKMAANLTPHASDRLRIVPKIWPIIPGSPRLTRLFQVANRWIAWARQKSFRLDRRVHWLGKQVRAGNLSWPFAFFLRVGLAGFFLLADVRKGAFL